MELTVFLRLLGFVARVRYDNEQLFNLCNFGFSLVFDLYLSPTIADSPAEAEYRTDLVPEQAPTHENILCNYRAAMRPMIEITIFEKKQISFSDRCT